ncbi:MAG: hypothetical protein PVJ86_06135 [Phycisphaerales bacterium]|jgi:UDP-N-acetylglucosamine 2-epimerase
MMKVICAYGAKRDFIKTTLIVRAFKSSGKFETLLVHVSREDFSVTMEG